MFALRSPTVDLHKEWLEAHHEWGPGAHEDGFGLDPSDDVESPAGFAAWVESLQQQSAPSRERRGTCRWIVEGNRVLGGIALRHGTDEVTRRNGHIGYGVRPSARHRGVATWALGEMLTQAKCFGLKRVLIVCEADNTASIKTIERHCGILDAIRETEHGHVRHYWVELDTRFVVINDAVDPPPPARA